MKNKSLWISIILLAFLYLQPAQSADLSKLAEMVRIVGEYDTIFVGKIKSVSYNPNSTGGHWDRFIVIVNAAELLKGSPLPPEVAICIHSPAQEFPLYEQSQLSGQRCAWALKRTDNRIVESRAVFPGQLFDDDDLAQLRRAIQSKRGYKIMGTKNVSSIDGAVVVQLGLNNLLDVTGGQPDWLAAGGPPKMEYDNTRSFDNVQGTGSDQKEYNNHVDPLINLQLRYLYEW